MFFVTFLRDGIAGADRELIEGTGRASLRDAGRFKPEFRGLKPTATIRLSLRDLGDGSERRRADRAGRGPSLDGMSSNATTAVLAARQCQPVVTTECFL